MKRVSFLLSASMTLFLFACNNGGKEETKTADTTAATATAPPPAAAEAKPAFTPFKVVVIQHKVKNFAKALAGYFSKDSLLSANGIHHLVVARDLKDSNQIFVLDRVDDVDKAKAFFNNPKVVETMSKAGVSRAPGYSFAEVVRYDDSPLQYTDAVSVAHHVKDYDAWLKAFNAEGTAARAANGLIDRIIARDVHDPNTVYLTFQVSDMAKAKARMTSPELKKIMTDAGVDTPPTIRWFSIQK